MLKKLRTELIQDNILKANRWNVAQMLEGPCALIMHHSYKADWFIKV
jgi:hypothetical protein